MSCIRHEHRECSATGAGVGRRTDCGSRHRLATGGRQFLRLTWPHRSVGSMGAVPTRWGLIPAMSSLLARSASCGASDDGFAATQSRWSRCAVDPLRSASSQNETRESGHARPTLVRQIACDPTLRAMLECRLLLCTIRSRVKGFY